MNNKHLFLSVSTSISILEVRKLHIGIFWPVLMANFILWSLGNKDINLILRTQV